MNKEIKQKWLEALRSGRYEQGTGRLRSNHGKYCCLGVLEDVVQPEGWLRTGGCWKNRDKCSGFISHATLYESNIPPKVAYYLMSMNDDSGKTFSEIADWIEANL